MPETNPPDRPVAIITGAARGLGLATAERLLAGDAGETGYAVCVLDIHAPRIEELQARAQREPERFMAALASVTEPDAIAEVVERVLERWGRIDLLVNNAGLNRRGGVFEHTLDDWNAVLAVNLTGAFICSAAVAPVMRDAIEAGRQPTGVIVNIGSTAAAAQGGGSIAYATTKGGLHVFTKALAHELGRSAFASTRSRRAPRSPSGSSATSAQRSRPRPPPPRCVATALPRTSPTRSRSSPPTARATSPVRCFRSQAAAGCPSAHPPRVTTVSTTARRATRVSLHTSPRGCRRNKRPSSSNGS